VELVVALLETGVDPAALDDRGFAALHFAAQQDQVATAAALLESGAPVDPHTHAGAAPLDLAIAFGRNGDMIDLLLTHGADPLQPGPGGETPLSVAREYVNSPAARFLVERYSSESDGRSA
jgi:ankyrin repeat protein